MTSYKIVFNLRTNWLLSTKIQVEENWNLLCSWVSFQFCWSSKTGKILRHREYDPRFWCKYRGSGIRCLTQIPKRTDLFWQNVAVLGTSIPDPNSSQSARFTMLISSSQRMLMIWIQLAFKMMLSPNWTDVIWCLPPGDMMFSVTESLTATINGMGSKLFKTTVGLR